MMFKCVEGCTKCCFLVPIEEDIWEKFKHLAKVERIERISNGKEERILPVTKDGMCPFLEAGSCLIYCDRPQLCKEFGTIDQLPCPELTTSGRPKNRAEKRATERFWAEMMHREARRVQCQNGKTK